MQIDIYDEINDSHVGTGHHGRTDLPGFHVFTMEATYPHTRKVMPPYRFNFYQIVLLENSADASLDVNAHKLQNLSNSLLVASPEHVLAWVRGEAQRGYILYFKAAFLAHYPRLIPDEFPFFRLTELNYLRVDEADRLALRGHFTRLLDVFSSEHPYRGPMLQAFLLALLYDCKRLFDQQEHTIQRSPPQAALVYRFQQFVNQHYLTRKRVSDYADLLAVSPDYLGQVVKAVTGTTPLNIIAQRILLEAKTLLAYSDLNVGQVATCLGYEEQTHFGRFFRKHTGMSPSAWRQQQS